MARTFIEEVRALQLSEVVTAAVKGYEEVGDRNGFLWPWVRRGVEITSLSSIERSLWDHVCDTKTLGVMFDVLLDDVADVGGDSEFLELLVGITENREGCIDGLTPDERACYDYSRLIWRMIHDRLAGYPRFEEFRDVLVYDYRQLMNSMRYSVLIQKYPSMMNLPEHDAYFPHNMHMMISSTIDIMASPTFDLGELGAVRRAVSYAQRMGRIGNLVTTWEREIRERDFSSGVFAYALQQGVITLDDLESCEHEALCERIRKAEIESYFLGQWQELHDEIAEMVPAVGSVDLSRLVDGLETLIQLHLGSRGLK